ncbi:unnamed protein product [Cuscuta epithymum]|uniref:Uncharacterized protein n=1 Tax=Cuscuta epithymum TaxID=186058 RepID=A0AAV0DHJ7_9ASTE|nr:unnamed protein product [Cuscuta epithymum]
MEQLLEAVERSYANGKETLLRMEARMEEMWTKLDESVDSFRQFCRRRPRDRSRTDRSRRSSETKDSAPEKKSRPISSGSQSRMNTPCSQTASRVAASSSQSRTSSQSQAVSHSSSQKSSQSASSFISPSSQIRTTSLSSHLIPKAFSSAIHSHQNATLSREKSDCAQILSQVSSESLTASHSSSTLAVSHTSQSLRTSFSSPSQTDTSHPPDYVSLLPLPYDKMNSKQFDKNTSKLNKSEDGRQEQSSVVQVHIPEIRSVAGMIRKFPSSFASLTLVHMDGKHKDNRKLNQVINESTEFLFSKVIPGKYSCKVRNSLGVLYEEDRWYGDKNLAYFGHSVQKNIRDANEHKVVMLLSLDSSDMGLKGADNFTFGSSVEEKVDEIKEIGAVDNFKNHGDVIGFNSEYQWGGTNVNLDNTIQAAVLNVPKYLVSPTNSWLGTLTGGHELNFQRSVLSSEGAVQGVGYTHAKALSRFCKAIVQARQGQGNCLEKYVHKERVLGEITQRQ